MFTGLVEAVGSLRKKAMRDRGARLTIACDLGVLALGESVNVSGACLTVVASTADAFEADLSRETLDRTTLGHASIGAKLNLERAMTLGGRMGGHVVTGHVDGVGELVAKERANDATALSFAVGRELAPYLAEKGSVTVDGVSLTVNGVSDARDRTTFHLMVIPHTENVTTLGALEIGAKVNLEVDVMARYVKRQLDYAAKNEATDGAAHDARLLEKLKSAGFV